jgi:hypothetical protein
MAMEKVPKNNTGKSGDTNLKSASNASFFRILFFLSMMKSLYKKNMSKKEIYIIKK